MAFARYTHIAVTKNFRGSPHMDHQDISYQYAIALGMYNNPSSNPSNPDNPMCAR